MVINLSGAPADGIVHVDHASAAGRQWQLTDLLGGAVYQRDGDDLGANGLYVSRPAWGVHVLAATPAGISIPDVALAAPRAS